MAKTPDEFNLTLTEQLGAITRSIQELEIEYENTDNLTEEEKADFAKTRQGLEKNKSSLYNFGKRK